MKRISVLIFLLAVGSSAWAQFYESADEQEIVRLVNTERARAGLGSLSIDDRLTHIARQHTVLLLKHSALSHQFPEEPDLRHRVVSSGVRFDMSGENVAYDRDAPSAHKSLMNSPPHRANILRPEFTAIGVGVIRKGDSIYVTEDFARTLEEYSPTQAEAAVTRAFATLRRSDGQPPMKLVSQPTLSDLACNMARNDRLELDLARDIPNVRSVLAWTATDPKKLPPDMQKWKSSKATQWSMGACFGPSRSYPNPVWWMVAVTYF